ncbi:MAG: hypothetical protein ACR2OO_16170 [Thermomicrobiales bacterium]
MESAGIEPDAAASGRAIGFDELAALALDADFHPGESGPPRVVSDVDDPDEHAELKQDAGAWSAV